MIETDPRKLAGWKLALTAIAAITTVALAYLPGLSGGFLFDDFVNLQTLGDYGRIDNLNALLYYLTSGIADPTGRPISLATFLIDARDWPADPFPFKRTNLFLHLLNGVLLFVVTCKFEMRLQDTLSAADAARSRWIALFTAFVWLAHPLFVSTTLYVVQRHAMLPLTFVLLALLCWDTAYGRLLDDRKVAGVFWTVLGVGGATLFAGLSKANGFLAPLLVLVAVATLYMQARDTHSAHAARRIRWVAGVVLGIPSLLLVLFLLSQIPGNLDYAGTREFTLAERLLTQPRVLVDYLGSLVLPRAGGGGVFVEDFIPSSGWLTPFFTLPAIICVVAILSLAVGLRKRFPVASFAILFFFSAHLMESSTIMLELYFEHRNYLPAAFLAWPMARWLIAGIAARPLRLALMGVIPLILLTLTWQRSIVWGDPALLAELSARDNPRSDRAQVIAAIAEGNGGSPSEAAQRLRDAIQSSGPTTELALNLMGQECATEQGLSTETLELTKLALSQEKRWHAGVIDWLRSATDLAADKNCKGFSFDTSATLMTVMGKNPDALASPTRRQNYAHLQGYVALRAGLPIDALALFNQALDAEPNIDTALTQAAMLGNLGHPELGVQHIDHYLALTPPTLSEIRNMQTLHKFILHRTGYYPREAAHLRDALAEAMASERSDGPI